jgi:hypothetical protein
MGAAPAAKRSRPVAPSYVLAAKRGGHGRVVFQDGLRSRSSAGRPEGEIELTAAGFRSQGGRLIFDAGEAVEDGQLDFTMAGAAFPARGANKSHVVTLWENEGFPAGGGSFIQWRIGSEDALKALAAPDGSGTRHEAVPPPAFRVAALDDGRPHRYRTTWRGGRVSMSVDGHPIAAFAFERMAIRYVVLGPDRKGAGSKLTDPAPTISDLRLSSHDEPLPASSPEARVPQFGRFERAFTAAGRHQNPYRQVTAVATIRRVRGGPARILPLFWDGDTTFRLRVSPASPGRYTYSVRSNDRGLDGQQGTFECVRGKLPGALTVIDGELRRQGGEAFWLLGDTQWSAFHSHAAEALDRASVRRYVDVRAGQGFNFVQTNLLGRAENEGGPAFADYETERLNPGYWRELERRLEHMNAQGVTAMVLLANAGPPGSRAGSFESDRTWRDFPSAAARRRYVSHVVGRLSAYDVVFGISGSWDGSARGAAWDAEVESLGQRVKVQDLHGRLVVLHPGARRSHAAPAPPRGAPGLRAAGQAAGFGDYGTDRDDLHESIMASARPGPGVTAGYGLYTTRAPGEASPLGPLRLLDEMRHCTWDVVMAGHNVVTAFENTVLGGADAPGSFDVDAPENDAWEAQVQHLRRFFAELMPRDGMRGGWNWLRAADGAATGESRVRYTAALDRAVPAGRPDDLRPPAEAAWVLAKPGYGFTAAIYLRGRLETYRLQPFDESIDHPAAPVPEYVVKRFDPRTGAFEEVLRHRGTSAVELSPPDARDWVFVVRRANAWRPPGHRPAPNPLPGSQGRAERPSSPGASP